MCAVRIIGVGCVMGMVGFICATGIVGVGHAIAMVGIVCTLEGRGCLCCGDDRGWFYNRDNRGCLCHVGARIARWWCAGLAVLLDAVLWVRSSSEENLSG